MRNRIFGKPCVFCGAASSRVGEHVWPKWYVKEFHGEGPFGANKDGVPYRTRNGDIAYWGALPSAHVPACEECNGKLGKWIEEPAKSVIRRLLPKSETHLWPSVTSDEARALARWFLKVGLLLDHPKAVHDMKQVDQDSDFRRLDHIEPEWLSWMPTGDDPTDGFSVYVARMSVQDEGPWNGEEHRTELPVVSVGTRRLHFQRWNFGIRGLIIWIAWHPGWPLSHALVEQGRAVELWPSVPAVNFAVLPEVHPAEFDFYVGGTRIPANNEDELAPIAQYFYS